VLFGIEFHLASSFFMGFGFLVYTKTIPYSWRRP